MGSESGPFEEAVPDGESLGRHYHPDSVAGGVEAAVSDGEVLPPASCDAVIPGREATVEYT